MYLKHSWKMFIYQSWKCRPLDTEHIHHTNNDRATSPTLSHQCASAFYRGITCGDKQRSVDRYISSWHLHKDWAVICDKATVHQGLDENTVSNHQTVRAFSHYWSRLDLIWQSRDEKLYNHYQFPEQSSSNFKRLLSSILKQDPVSLIQLLVWGV